jgi:hypothetical protein
MKRYKYTKLLKLGPVDGFMIHTPDDRELKDTHPQTIVKELNRMADRIKRLEEALETLTCVIGLTPIKGNLAALQEAFDMARAVLKAKEAK